MPIVSLAGMPEMSGTRWECPLCDYTAERTKVYKHLQTSHRKSELSRKVLEAEYADADWVGEKYCKAPSAD